MPGFVTKDWGDLVPPYYSEDFFSVIRSVEDDGLLSVKTMTVKDWYRSLIEKHCLKVEIVSGAWVFMPSRAGLSSHGLGVGVGEN